MLVSAPEPLLETLQTRARALEEHYELAAWEAYAAAACHLSDWHVEQAIQLRDRRGLLFSRAIYEVKDWQPRITRYLPAFHVEQEPPAAPAEPPQARPAAPVTLNEARSHLMASLCYYSLIRYKAAPGRPVIGIIVVCPGKSVSLVRSHLSITGVLPRTRRWRKLDEYLRFERYQSSVTLEELEQERTELRASPSWSALLEMDPIQAVIASPKFLMHKLYEEHIMGKSVGTMSEREIHEAIGGDVAELKVSLEEPSDHHMIHKHLNHMDLDDLRYWMRRLRNHSSPTATADRELLKDRLIFVLTLERPGLAVVVQDILEDAKQVHNLL